MNCWAQVADRLSRRGDGGRLSGASRGLDHATQQLIATARPLRRTQFRRDRLEHNLGLFTQTANQARNLVAIVEASDDVDPGFAREIAIALERDSQRIAAIERSPSETAGGGRDRDEGLVAGIERSLAVQGGDDGQPERRLLRRLDRLDEAITELEPRDGLLILTAVPLPPSTIEQHARTRARQAGGRGVLVQVSSVLCLSLPFRCALVPVHGSAPFSQKRCPERPSPPRLS